MDKHITQRVYEKVVDRARQKRKKGVPYMGKARFEPSQRNPFEKERITPQWK